MLVENAHKKIEDAEREAQGDRTELVIASARELGPSMFGALLVLTIAFLPVFALQGEEGRLFRPLALAKTFSMAFASLFAVTLVPALMVTFLRGKIRPEAKNPINRFCIAAYRPVLRVLPARPVRRHRGRAGAPRCVTVVPVHAPRLGVHAAALRGLDPLHADHRPRHLDRGGASGCSTWQDAQIKSGARGRARVRQGRPRRDARSIPAPLSMFETIVHLKPREQWRPGMTQEKLVAELERRRSSCPGVQGAWTMPIKARIDMLSTGIRTPIGVKVFGPTSR